MLDPVAAAIERFSPRTVGPDAARFARQLCAEAEPSSLNQAKAFLFAACRLGAFGEQVGLDLSREVLLRPSVIERCCASSVSAMSAPTRRTLRSNLRAIARRVAPQTAPERISRGRAKAPYSPAEIAGYLAVADAQPTRDRSMHASALICLGAGAGLVGADLKTVRGSDVAARAGGIIVEVRAGRCPRVVPVLGRYHARLVCAAEFSGTRLLIGGTSPVRRNVTTPLTASIKDGSDLPRLDVARLRATWLCEVAQAIGLKAFMDAAGIVCSQRLGDLIAHLGEVDEAAAVALLGGSS